MRRARARVRRVASRDRGARRPAAARRGPCDRRDARRRIRPGRRRARVRRRVDHARRPRRAGQQRGHRRPDRRHRRNRLRAVGADRRDQPERAIPVRPPRGAAAARVETRRRDHRAVVGRRPARLCVPHAVRGHQMGGGRPREEPRDRARAARHPRERDPARHRARPANAPRDRGARAAARHRLRRNGKALSREDLAAAHDRSGRNRRDRAVPVLAGRARDHGQAISVCGNVEVL